MKPDIPGRLEEQVRELTARVWQLETALRLYGIVVDEVQAPATEPASPSMARSATPSWTAEVERIAKSRTTGATQESIDTGSGQAPSQAAQTTAQTPIATHSFPYMQAAGQGTGGISAEDGRSLESRIGSQWFNRIGILAVLIAVAWFLKMAFDNHWIGPLGRVLIGLVAGAGIVAWSERFQSKGFTAFAYSLKAVGSGILYLSLWASFSVFHLVPASVAFAAMILVTAFNGFMAWVQDAELLALYAIAGGLSTPLLLSTGENHEVTLFSYLLLMDIAVLVLAALRPWSRLLFAAYIGTVVFIVGWWSTFYGVGAFGWTTFFLTSYFLIFAFAPRLVRANGDDGATVSGWDALAGVLLPVANAGLGFLGFYLLFDSKGMDWAGPWLAVAFAAYYLALMRLPAFGRLRASGAVLSGLHLTAAVVFLTMAIPLKAHGSWLTIGWLAEGVVLLWSASRLRSMLLRVLAIGCLALGLIALLVLALMEIDSAAYAVPIFNERFGDFCAGIAAFAIACWIARKANAETDAEKQDGWQAMSAVAALIVSGLILLSVSLEIHHYWWMRPWRGDYRAMHNYQMIAQFTYSAWFMLYGAILLGAGFWRRSAFLRWQALVLLAVSIAKVFLVDVSELAEGYRILSFLGLGALLLAVSYVYQRDWLNLRNIKGQDS
ncbi:MAG: DUF2339 domain-containing protein [Terracidiphilus sp.]